MAVRTQQTQQINSSLFYSDIVIILPLLNLICLTIQKDC